MVQYGRPSRSSWKESVWSSFSRTVMWKAICENPIETVGRRFQIGNAYSYTVKKGSFLSVYADDIKLAGKKQHIDPMWKVLSEEVDLVEPTSFLDHVYLVTQRQCEISKDIVDNYRTMFESWIQQEQLKNYHAREICVFLRGPTVWKVAREMGSPRKAFNRRRRTRKGPEPACVQTPLHIGCGTRRLGRMN